MSRAPSPSPRKPALDDNRGGPLTWPHCRDFRTFVTGANVDGGACPSIRSCKSAAHLARLRTQRLPPFPIQPLRAFVLSPFLLFDSSRNLDRDGATVARLAIRSVCDHPVRHCRVLEFAAAFTLLENTDMVFCARREPRSAGYPPLRHPRHSELSPSHTLPAPGPRHSDPGPSVSPQYRSRMEYPRNYSVASTASTVSSASSTNSSFFGKSYSLSSGMKWPLILVADLPSLVHRR